MYPYRVFISYSREDSDLARSSGVTYRISRLAQCMM